MALSKCSMSNWLKISVLLFLLLTIILSYSFLNQSILSSSFSMIIIKNGTILTMDSDKTVIKSGVVVINGNKIIDVGTEKLLEQYKNYSSSENIKIIDAKNGIVLPGMINAHSHLPMIAFRGLGEEGIKNRLFAYFFPLEQEKLSRDLIYKATIHGTIDMAMSGVTTYADMYYHMDEMAKATKEVGLRAVLAETIIKFPVVDAKEPFGGIQYAEKFINEYKNDELITPAFGPHSAYLVSEEKLLEIKTLSDKYNASVLIHAAEFEDEADRLPGKYKGSSPIKLLDDIGLLNKKTLLAHGIYLSDEDIKLIAEKKPGFSYNGIANAKGATGIARIYELQKAGFNRIGLGTDGPMSSNFVGIIQAMGYGSSMQRLKYNDRTIMTPDIMVEMATIGGARALNMEDKIGSIERGKLADIVIFETQSPNMIPNYEPYATIVWQSNPGNVDTTIVNGRIIVENKVLKTYDIERNRKNMEEITLDIAEFAKELAKKAKDM